MEFFISEYYTRSGEEANAKAHYEKAIEESFASAGVEGTVEHIAKYPFDMANYKQCIGVQKWIALSGVNTFEAWCEARRLNYPAFDTTKKGTDFYKKGDDTSFLLLVTAMLLILQMLIMLSLCSGVSNLWCFI